MKNKILKIVQSLLIARRNRNLRLADKSYQKLVLICQENGIDFNNALDGATKELQHKISNIMQGVS